MSVQINTSKFRTSAAFGAAVDAFKKDITGIGKAVVQGIGLAAGSVNIALQKGNDPTGEGKARMAAALVNNPDGAKQSVDLGVTIYKQNKADTAKVYPEKKKLEEELKKMGTTKGSAAPVGSQVDMLHTEGA